MSDMHPPKMKYEVNLNTIALLLTLVVSVGGGFYFAGQQTKRLDGLDTWVERHDQLQATRSADMAAKFADANARITSNQVEARKIDNLAYRTTVLEQGAANTQKSLGDLKEQLGSLSADIRVVREILQRMDKEGDR